MSQSQQVLFAAVLRLLRPLVRIMLRNGVPYGAFSELVKKTYVDVAESEFTVEGKMQTKSRIATITGLTRREVVRLKGVSEYDNEELVTRFNRAARVVSGWVRDYRFTDKDGDPAELPYDKGEHTFSDLVFSYSGDVPPRAVLDELLNSGVVERDGNTVKLLSRGYVPSKNIDEKLAILGTDTTLLLETIDHNIYAKEEAPRFHRKVYYDNLPVEVIPKFQALVRENGQSLLETLDQYISRYDRDNNPDQEGSGRVTAGLTLFYFQEVENED
ncbi:MAG: DUF6502 family protein [Gammaproteobacteria bacterium]|nr:DUF6502 family protein [Gammaproteobacteria bacterium]